MIRAARSDELALLRTLEQAAGAPFRELAMHAIADDEPLSLESLAVFVQAGRAWVIADVQDRPIAYLLVDVLDGSAHIEQVRSIPITPGAASGQRCSTTRPPGATARPRCVDPDHVQ